MDDYGRLHSQSYQHHSSGDKAHKEKVLPLNNKAAPLQIPERRQQQERKPARQLQRSNSPQLFRERHSHNQQLSRTPLNQGPNLQWRERQTTSAQRPPHITTEEPEVSSKNLSSSERPPLDTI
ncbi:hypothetical protein F2Q70_00018143 [Brassica cretica]|uniref:Uncharacterized protein n=1 Tax=Brassica cretica TaxID=69181 RepID=A0A8S9I1P9_BRACR|nr:hypothetical protein F2Q70_00018143 [Brassica cretica]